VSTVKSKGKIRVASKNGPTKFSEYIEESYLKERPHFWEFFSLWMEKNHTLIFEWISPEDQIVLKYPEPSMTLLAIRDNFSGFQTVLICIQMWQQHLGNYVNFQLMTESAEQHKIPVVKRVILPISSVSEPAAFLSAIKQEKDIEGCVLRYRNHHPNKTKQLNFM
jgi:hypothetical protein